MLDPKHPFPFGIFNQELIESAPAILKSMEEEQKKYYEIADKAIELFDGMNLEEVEQALLVLRARCRQHSVIKK